MLAASRSRHCCASSSAGDSWARGCGRRRHQLLDARDQLLHPLAGRVRIEIGARKRRRPQRRRFGRRPGDSGRPVPAASGAAVPAPVTSACAHPACVWYRLSGASPSRRLIDDRLELADDRLARAGLLLQFELIAVLVAVEEPIAGGAEAVPDGFGLRLAHRPDRLPLGLQPLDLRRGVLPVGRFGERLGLFAQTLPCAARLPAHSSLRRFRSSWRRVKKRSQALRKRSQTAFSCHA